jgi:hypothetical protein
VKTLRQICAAAIITLILAVSVLAGHIETPAAPAPASTPATTAGSTAIPMLVTVLNLVYSRVV